MKYTRYIAILLLGLIAFNETIGFLPSEAGGRMLMLRWTASWAVYVVAWIFNKRVLQPHLSRKSRYGAYLLALTGVAAATECVAVCEYLTVFRFVTGTALLVICLGGLSAPALLYSWQELRRRSINAEKALLDVKIADRRLKIDSAAMNHALHDAARCCGSDTDRAVDILYQLSRDLRAQLYDRR